MAAHYWIQRHDFTSEEAENVTAAQAVAGWEGFDWTAELAAFDAKAEGRNCPPGFGLHNGYGARDPKRRLLHVCPIDRDSAFLNYHHVAEGKLLGLFATKKEKIEYLERLPRAEVPELIRLFCTEHHTELLARLQRPR